MKINRILEEQLLALNIIQEELNNISNITKQHVYDEQAVILKFITLLKKYRGNHVILKRFIDFIRVLKDKKLSNSFDIETLTNLFEVISEINSWDIDFEMERFFYYDVFVGDSTKSQHVLKNMYQKIQVIQNQINESKLDID